MTIEMARFLQACCDNAWNDCKVQAEYSGRGMFGQTTAAIVVDSATQLLADVIRYVSENIGEYSDPKEDNVTIKEWLGNEIPDVSSFRVDNLGSRIILY